MVSVNEASEKFSNNTAQAGNKWRSGVQNPVRNPSEGLNDVDGLDMAGRENEYDNYWSSQADTQDAQDKFESNAPDAADKWAENWGDAENWVIGED